MRKRDSWFARYVREAFKSGFENASSRLTACNLLTCASWCDITEECSLEVILRAGHMLAPSWEAHANRLAQASTTKELWAGIVATCAAESIPLRPAADPTKSKSPTASLRSPLGTSDHHIQGMAVGSARELLEAPVSDSIAVLLGQDTRASSPELAAAAAAGVRATGAIAVDVGLCSTPMLHYAVWEQGDDCFDGYYARLLDAFDTLTQGTYSLWPGCFRLCCAALLGIRAFDLLAWCARAL